MDLIGDPQSEGDLSGNKKQYGAIVHWRSVLGGKQASSRLFKDTWSPQLLCSL